MKQYLLDALPLLIALLALSGGLIGVLFGGRAGPHPSGPASEVGGEVHKLVDRLIDLITRQAISEAETDEVDRLIVRLRRQRALVEEFPLHHSTTPEALARSAAVEEGYRWENLPETTRRQFIREQYE